VTIIDRELISLFPPVWEAIPELLKTRLIILNSMFQENHLRFMVNGSPAENWKYWLITGKYWLKKKKK